MPKQNSNSKTVATQPVVVLAGRKTISTTRFVLDRLKATKLLRQTGIAALKRISPSFFAPPPLLQLTPQVPFVVGKGSLIFFGGWDIVMSDPRGYMGWPTSGAAQSLERSNATVEVDWVSSPGQYVVEWVVSADAGVSFLTRINGQLLPTTSASGSLQSILVPVTATSPSSVLLLGAVHSARFTFYSVSIRAWP